MTNVVRRLVNRRAGGVCEYCHLPQDGHEERFSVDHVIAQQHLTDDGPENLALCCLRCNLRKGPNLSGLDPADGSIVPLFNPRQQTWVEHFDWVGPRLAGRTPTGRATVTTLQMNALERVALRVVLLAQGTLPRR